MRRSLTVVVVAALALTAACGSSSPKGLSTPDFAKQANAICASIDTTIKKVPQPTASDLASLVPFAQGIETAYSSYLTQLTALTAKAQDHTAITTNWIGPATTDFAAAKPLFDQLIAAAQKRDTAATQAAATKLQGVTDHTAAIKAYQQVIGATTCSTLLSDISG